MAGRQTKIKPSWLPTAPEEPETPDVVSKKVVAAQPPVPASEEIKAFHLKLLEKKNIVESHHAGNYLALIEDEKRLSIVKTWLEYEKSKTVNKAQKELSVLAAWNNSEKAALQATFSNHQEQKDEKKKAEFYEKMNNKRALVQKQTEEKKALIQAKYCKKMVKIQAMAANYRQRETTPKKFLGCFWV